MVSFPICQQKIDMTMPVNQLHLYNLKYQKLKISKRNTWRQKFGTVNWCNFRYCSIFCFPHQDASSFTTSNCILVILNMTSLQLLDLKYVVKEFKLQVSRRSPDVSSVWGLTMCNGDVTMLRTLIPRWFECKNNHTLAFDAFHHTHSYVFVVPDTYLNIQQHS